MRLVLSYIEAVMVSILCVENVQRDCLHLFPCTYYLYLVIILHLQNINVSI